MATRVRQGFWMNDSMTAEVEVVDESVYSLSLQTLGEDCFNGLFSLDQLRKIEMVLAAFLKESGK